MYSTGNAYECRLMGRVFILYCCRSYDNKDGCVDDDISEYALYMNLHCYDSDSSSMLVDFPQLRIFDGTGCHPRKEQDPEDLNTECEETVSYSYDSSYFYEWLHQYYGGQETADAVPGAGERADEAAAFEGQEDVQYDYSYGPQGSIDLYNVWVLVDTMPPNMNKDPTTAPSLQPTHASAAPSYRPTHVPTLLPTHATAAPTTPPTPAAATAEVTIAPTPAAGSDSSDPSAAPVPAAPSTAAPSPLSPMPSARPHVTNQHCVMKIQQTVTGLVTEQFGDNAQSAFKSAVASALDGIKKSNVHVVGVRDKDGSRTLALPSSADGCFVTYRIEFNTFDANFPSAEEAFESLSTELNNAVSSGAFDDALHSYAVQYGAKKLLESHSSGLVFQDFTSVDATGETDDARGDGDGEDDDDDGAAATKESGSSASSASSAGEGSGDAVAIVVPILIIVIAIALVSACYCCRQRVQSLLNSRYASVSLESRHGSSLHGAPGAKPHGGAEDADEVEIQLSAVQQPQQKQQKQKKDDRSATFNPMLSNSSAVDDEEKDIHL